MPHGPRQAPWRGARSHCTALVPLCSTGVTWVIVSPLGMCRARQQEGQSQPWATKCCRVDAFACTSAVLGNNNIPVVSSTGLHGGAGRWQCLIRQREMSFCIARALLTLQVNGSHFSGNFQEFIWEKRIRASSNL